MAATRGVRVKSSKLPNSGLSPAKHEPTRKAASYYILYPYVSTQASGAAGNIIYQSVLSIQPKDSDDEQNSIENESTYFRCDDLYTVLVHCLSARTLIDARSIHEPSQTFQLVNINTVVILKRFNVCPRNPTLPCAQQVTESR